MFPRRPLFALILVLSSLLTFAQQYDSFLDRYHLNQTFLNEKPKEAKEYPDVQGNPYLDREFAEGTIYLKDTSAIKLRLRLNLYTDQFEYKLSDTVYIVGSPNKVNRIIIDSSVFIYLPFIGKPGYFELLAFGKSSLVLKRTVIFKPAEGPKPIEGTVTPARFDRDSDYYYIIVDGSKVTEVWNMKSVLAALQDQQAKLQEFINANKLKRASRENLVKIVDFYNTL